MNTKHTLVFLFTVITSSWIYGQDNKIIIENAASQKAVEIYSDLNLDGAIELFDAAEKNKVRIAGNLAPDGGSITLKDENETNKIHLSGGSKLGGGVFDLRNKDGENRIQMATGAEGYGSMRLVGRHGNTNLLFSESTKEGGAVSINDKNGTAKVTIVSDSTFGGAVYMGATSQNIRLTPTETNDDLGKISLLNAANNETVELESSELSGSISFRDTSDNFIAGMGGESLFGLLQLNSIDHSQAVKAADKSGYGYLEIFTDSTDTDGGTGNVTASLYSDSFANGNGALELFSKEEKLTPKVELLVPSYNSGELNLYGPNGSRNIGLGVPNTTDVDYGFIAVYDDNNQSRIQMLPDSIFQGAGVIRTFGENGSFNTVVGAYEHRNLGYFGAVNHLDQHRAKLYCSTLGGAGYVTADIIQTFSNKAVMWEDGNGGRFDIVGANAKIYVDGSGQGTIEADVKNFSMPHPVLEDKKIVYACIEGPEAAAYARGTAQLQNGKAIIQLPDHFTMVAAEEGMTVILTPLSADSKGLAVTSKKLDGITVQEMFSGTGDYEFDWEVKSIRKGFEDYKVIRDKDGPMQPYRDPNLEVRTVSDVMGQRK